MTVGFLGLGAVEENIWVPNGEQIRAEDER